MGRGGMPACSYDVVVASQSGFYPRIRIAWCYVWCGRCPAVGPRNCPVDHLYVLITAPLPHAQDNGVTIPLNFEEQATVLFEANSLISKSHRALSGGSLRSVTSFASAYSDDDNAHDAVTPVPEGQYSRVGDEDGEDDENTGILASKVSLGSALLAGGLAVVATALAAGVRNKF